MTDEVMDAPPIAPYTEHEYGLYYKVRRRGEVAFARVSVQRPLSKGQLLTCPVLWSLLGLDAAWRIQVYLLDEDGDAVKIDDHSLLPLRSRLEFVCSQPGTLYDVLKIVKLDVGGVHFTTSSATLCRDPDSMLAAMFSGRYPIAMDSDGRVFIDRDGSFFNYILNYLRDGTLEVPSIDTQYVLNRIRQEAEYYGLRGLVDLIDLPAKLEEEQRQQEALTAQFRICVICRVQYNVETQLVEEPCAYVHDQVWQASFGQWEYPCCHQTNRNARGCRRREHREL
eukprot:GILK01013497.1.p1 GENE.GILK01013497.1~~GILK01013497.1.p1  ORF type:complete len:298 (+),score=26.64 GILK01013497.1:53-895(+)